MLLCIPAVLTKDQAAHCLRQLEQASWVGGEATAGAQSRLVKDNAQVDETCPVGRRLGDLILDALAGAPLFVSAALPLKTFPPLFNRYAGGQSFGAHVDNAIRAVPGHPVRIRTDVSCTLFLSEPDSYDGGELVIEGPFGAQEVKLGAGDMILYPATSLHRVMPVTRGARIASFFWVQSMVRDAGARTTLFDLDQAVQSHAADLGHDHPRTVQLTAVYHNLIRLWADA